MHIPPPFHWEVKQNTHKKSQSNKSTNMAHKKLLYITYNIYRRGVYGGGKMVEHDTWNFIFVG